MNIEQENLRSKINNLINQYGIKANHICDRTNIDAAYFCRWRRGQRYLGTDDTKSIQKYLEEFKGML